MTRKRLPANPATPCTAGHGTESRPRGAAPRPASPAIPNRARVLAALILGLLLPACGPAQAPPSVLLALDGPSLFIAAEIAGRPLHGFMDRSVMAGTGNVILYDQQNRITCKGTMDTPASDKGRLYVTLTCGDGREMALAMRNLGPDQGMGVGRVQNSGHRLILFYHPCEAEARRRLRAVKADIARGEQARTADSPPKAAGPPRQAKNDM